MVDIVSKKKRSEMMSGIKGKNTKPEILVRQFLHQNGYRFRLHRKDLPGKPDIVLPKYNLAIQVRGCFWHMHRCQNGRLPKSNTDFWRDKLEKNAARDMKNDAALLALGWQLLIIWECDLKKDEASTLIELRNKLKKIKNQTFDFKS